MIRRQMRNLFFFFFFFLYSEKQKLHKHTQIKIKKTLRHGQSTNTQKTEQNSIYQPRPAQGTP